MFDFFSVPFRLILCAEPFSFQAVMCGKFRALVCDWLQHQRQRGQRSPSSSPCGPHFETEQYCWTAFFCYLVSSCLSKIDIWILYHVFCLVWLLQLCCFLVTFHLLVLPSSTTKTTARAMFNFHCPTIWIQFSVWITLSPLFCKLAYDCRGLRLGEDSCFVTDWLSTVSGTPYWYLIKWLETSCYFHLFVSITFMGFGIVFHVQQ